MSPGTIAHYDGRPRRLRRISRAKGLELVERVLAAAEVIVAAPGEYLVEPVAIALFGSLLDPARPTVGDVDVMLDSRWLWGTEGYRVDLANELFIRDQRTGRSVHDVLNWPRRKMLRRLRDRSPYVRLHSAWRDGELDCLVRVVWRRERGRLEPPLDQNAREFAAWCEANLTRELRRKR